MKSARIYLKLFTPFIYSYKSCYIIYNNNNHEFIINYNHIMKRITISSNMINANFSVAFLYKHKKWYKLKTNCCEENNACYIYNLFLVLQLWNLKLTKNIN